MRGASLTDSVGCLSPMHRKDRLKLRRVLWAAKKARRVKAKVSEIYHPDDSAYGH